MLPLRFFFFFNFLKDVCLSTLKKASAGDVLCFGQAPFLVGPHKFII